MHPMRDKNPAKEESRSTNESAKLVFSLRMRPERDTQTQRESKGRGLFQARTLLDVEQPLLSTSAPS